MIHVTFILPNGERCTVEGREGESLLELTHRLKLPLEGACEGALACSTCHVIIRERWLAKLPAASDAEEDRLDYAFGLTSTSRLGCQIRLTQALDGLVVEIPRATRNS